MEPMFEIGTKVRTSVSGETGTVIGVAEYAESRPQALIRYLAADGRATESWWAISALEAA